MSLKIYGISASRAIRPLWVAEELGLSYEHVPVPYQGGATRTPEFLALNPNGHIPVVDDDGIIVWESMACALYLEGGIRGVEIGSVMFGKRLEDGTESYHSMELVRLAFPRRMYTQSHFDYAAEVIAEVKEKAASIRGVKITKQPQYLRHFTCECAWV